MSIQAERMGELRDSACGDMWQDGCRRGERGEMVTGGIVNVPYIEHVVKISLPCDTIHISRKL